MSQSTNTSGGPPYPPRTAALGGRPTVHEDVPILAVFLAMYIAGAATNMTIFQINKRRSIKFIPSAVLFGFNMSRIVTCIMRMAWATHPNNLRLGIASNVFVNAGILLVYVLNIIFAQRILRARKPHIGWQQGLRVAFKVIYISIPLALVLAITGIVLSNYSRNPDTLQATRDLFLTSSTYLLILTALPIAILAVAWMPPSHPQAEHFGQHSMLSKTLVLITSVALCLLIQGFKTGTTWMPARPVNNPAWYQSKAAFYCFIFVPEPLIVLLLTVSRMDKKFHVPNGSKGPGDYSRPVETDEKVAESTNSFDEVANDTERAVDKEQV